MNGQAELLNFIYQNAEMGVDTLNQLIPMIESESFKECVEKHLAEYQNFHQKAKELLNQHGYDEKGINTFNQIKTYIMVNLQTLTDKSTSHLAEMMIIGSNMGVIQAIRKMKEYKNAEEDILILMKELQKFEEYNIEQYKKFI